jgi:hypothetical protein
MADAWCNDME